MSIAPPKDRVVARLRSMPMFADLAPAELEALSRLVRPRSFPKGAFIINQHETGGCMYLLVAGRAKITLASPDGKELVLDYLEAPAHFGETSLVDRAPRSSDVVAMSDVEVLALDARDLAAAIRLEPRLALSLVGTLSSRLRQTISRLEDMAFHDATHRVMRVLLNVATATYESKGVPVIEGLTHYDIATLAGTSRETASRVISGLGRDGALATRGRRIVVDLLKLRDRLEVS